MAPAGVSGPPGARSLQYYRNEPRRIVKSKSLKWRFFGIYADPRKNEKKVSKERKKEEESKEKREEEEKIIGKRRRKKKNRRGVEKRRRRAPGLSDKAESPLLWILNVFLLCFVLICPLLMHIKTANGFM